MRFYGILVCTITVIVDYFVIVFNEEKSFFFASHIAFPCWIVSILAHLLDRQDGISLTYERLSLICLIIIGTLDIHEIFIENFDNNHIIQSWIISTLGSALVNLFIRKLPDASVETE